MVAAIYDWSGFYIGANGGIEPHVLGYYELPRCNYRTHLPIKERCPN
jgi:hypothetical protein